MIVPNNKHQHKLLRGRAPCYQAFCDLEAFYTYEGTYDINTLVAGRGITGMAAIKPPNDRSKRGPDVQA